MQPANELYVIDRHKLHPMVWLWLAKRLRHYPHNVQVGDTVLVHRCIDWQAPLLFPPFVADGRLRYGHSRWQWVEREVVGVVWDKAAPCWKLQLAGDRTGALCGNDNGLLAGYKLPQTNKQLAAA